MSDYDRKDDVLIHLLIEKIDELSGKLDTHMKEEGEQIKELIEVFNTAKHVVWFVKVAAIVVGALGTAWAFLNGHFTVGIK